MNTQKRVAAIHDISGFGRCSLTVALPIISAAGVECSVLPTAVLSTHTGGFGDFTYNDLTSDIMPIANHWKSLDIKFDALYSGYLGSFEQLDMVADIFDMFKQENTLILVDPVMADNGQLYASFSDEFPKGMAKLCAKADIIVPNITEACLMTDTEYIADGYDKSYIENLLRKLGDLCAGKVVLTGVSFDTEKLGAATYDTATSKTDYVFSRRIMGSYHGTGDVFGSALLSALMNDFSLSDSAQIAADYTANSLQRSVDAKADPRCGVQFEKEISSFLKMLKLS